MTNRNSPNTTPLDEIPKKIYYSISEASEFTGVEPHVLRYWETKFSKLNPKRVGGNQRKYTRNDIELLYEIVNLLYCEGYTLDGAERKLKGGLQALRTERENGKSDDDFGSDSVDEDSIEQESETELEAETVGSIETNELTLAALKKELYDLLHLLDDCPSI